MKITAFLLFILSFSSISSADTHAEQDRIEQCYQLKIWLNSGLSLDKFPERSEDVLAIEKYKEKSFTQLLKDIYTQYCTPL